MEALLVSKKNMLIDIDRRTCAVIFTFRPSALQVLRVAEKGKTIRTMFFPPSVFNGIAKSTIQALDMMHITALKTPTNLTWGVRQDLHGRYVNIPDEKQMVGVGVRAEDEDE
ncbi:DUF1699 family protein [Candidatus Pacearchaeota archaeon]|jgi:hypothetical protein|nr:DUF1699 family protein [Candidatus Pacearchaeota archaeon]